MPRIYIAGSIGKSEIITGKRETHYLRDVLRMKKGERITVLDGEEGEGYIGDRFKGSIVISIKQWKKIERKLEVSITLGQGLLKGEKMDAVIEKATEIGVSDIIPLVTERVIARDAGIEKRRRWERIAAESAKLGGRTSPKISPPMALNDFLSSPFKKGDLKLVPWEEEKEAQLLNILIERSALKEAAVVIGPEGGFSAGEVSQLKEDGFKTCSLGPLIMRSETAAIYILSCLANFYNGSFKR